MNTTPNTGQVLTDGEIVDALHSIQNPHGHFVRERAIEAAVLAKVQHESAALQAQASAPAAVQEKAAPGDDVLIAVGNSVGLGPDLSVAYGRALLARHGAQPAASVTQVGTWEPDDPRWFIWNPGIVRDSFPAGTPIYVGQPAASAAPFAVLTVHKHGAMSVLADGQSLREKPITDEDRKFWRERRGCEIVEVFRSPVAAQPKRRPYNTSGSLSEYGVFPECDAAQAQPHPDELPGMWDASDLSGGMADAQDAAQASGQAQEDTALLDWLREETCDLRCIDMPTGAGDGDVRWVVVQHHMAEPREREIGRSHTDDPRDAIRAARAAGGEHE